MESAERGLFRLEDLFCPNDAQHTMKIPQRTTRNSDGLFLFEDLFCPDDAQHTIKIPQRTKHVLRANQPPVDGPARNSRTVARQRFGVFSCPIEDLDDTIRIRSIDMIFTGSPTGYNSLKAAIIYYHVVF